jgi:RHS repeat-associated protein
VSTSITYEPLTNSTVYTKGTGAAWPQTDLIDPMYVVSEVDNDDGTFTNGFPNQHAMTYKYTGLRSDAVHGDLGFASMTVIDTRTDTRTATDFDQTYPYIGMVLDTTTTVQNIMLSKSTATLADIPTTYTSNNGVTLTTHCPYAIQLWQKSYDLSGDFISSSLTTTSNFDGYGNPGTVHVQSLDATVNSNGYGNPTGYEKITVSSYDNDTTNWILGHLSSVHTTSMSPFVPAISSAPATPASSITHTSEFFYYPGSGLLQQEITEPNDSSPATDPQKLATSYIYDAFGNITSLTTSGAGFADRTISTVYDGNGQFPVKTTNALNQSETYTYDHGLGVLTSQTGPNGLTTRWSYDGMGRKIREARPDGTSTEINYRWAGSNAPPVPTGSAPIAYLIETETSGAPPSLAFYDSMGRDIYTFSINGGDFNGNPRIVGKETQYDSMGRPWWTSLPFYYLDPVFLGTEVSSDNYDALNRPLQEETADEEAPGGYVTSTFEYDGLVSKVTDPKGRVTITTKNSQGQVLSVVTNANATATSTDRGETDYTYNADGNVLTTSVVNNNNLGTPVTTSFTYDLSGRKQTMNDPDRGGWSYTYDAEGELISQTDAKGQTATMAYDVLGRLVTRTEPEGTTTWTYDTAANGVGELASITAPNNYSESYTYDSFGRAISTTRIINTTLSVNLSSGIDTFTVGQQYDAYGRPTIGTYPGGYQVENVYNDFGFLKEVRQANADETGQNPVFWQADSYSLWGGVNGCTYGNGITEDTIVAATTGHVLGFGIGVNEDVAFYTYTHDALGNIINRNDEATGRNETYFYDGLNRLTKRTLTVNGQSGAPDQTVAYDSLGNMTNKADVGNYRYGENGAGGPHAVTTAGNKSYLYDANGNMSKSTILVGGVSTTDRNIGWTSFNQVKHIDENGHSSDFTFDADHQRVTQKTEHGTTVYVGSDFEYVADSSGVKLKYYIFTPSGRSVVRTVDGGLVETRYLHQDVLGSVIAVTDEDGDVVERYAYDPWGKQTTLVASTSSLGPATTRGFTDHEMLQDLGLIHMNGRIYDPVLGRFLSSDSVIQDVGDSQAFNRYSYVGNNPVNSIDPSGHSWLSSFLRFLRKKTRDDLIGPFPKLNPLSGPINRLYAWGESHQQELEIAAIIVASIFTAGAASAATSEFLGSMTTTTTMTVTSDLGTFVITTTVPNAIASGLVAFGLPEVVGGAVGGFVSGAGMASMNRGGSFDRDLTAGLKGAEFGALSAGITAGMGDLNGAFNVNLTITGLPGSPGAFGQDLKDIAGQGLENAAVAKLKNQNASTAFWSGAIMALGGPFKLGNKPTEWPSLDQIIVDDLATSVLGGLSSMNKEGEGFGNGAWNKAFGLVGGQFINEYVSNSWLKAAYGSVESGLAGGLKSKLGGTAVSLGFRTAFYTSLASSGIDKISSSFGDSGDFSGQVSSGYALVQPKTSTSKKTHVTTTTIPLTGVKGGTWANAAPWAQLYSK